MSQKKSLFFVLSAMVFFAGLAGSAYAKGQEQDRGTVKMPDYVATPHPEETMPAEDPLTKVQNKSLADDSNRDGTVSREEWQGTAEDFTRLDANDDNLLSQRELESYVQIGIDRFAEWDANRDGILSRNEWRDRGHLFRKLDRDKNGMLTRNEFYFE